MAITSIPMYNRETTIDGAWKRVGLEIRTIRRAKGWKIYELANRAGYTADHIGYIERGKRYVNNLDLLSNIAGALEVPLWNLIEKAGYDLGLGGETFE
jgi:transcriptional regulator with XRE-family HTH domain